MQPNDAVHHFRCNCSSFTDCVPQSSVGLDAKHLRRGAPYQWVAILIIFGADNPCSRHILQLHHDDGGQQRGPHRRGAELPPQDGGDPRHADLGEN